MAEILVFCDTEFSSLESPELISLGLVASETDAELYIEAAGARELAVSDFVRAEVFPLLGRHNPTVLDYDDIAGAIEVWCDELRGSDRSISIVLVCDSPLDWALVSELRIPMPGEVPWTRVANIVGRLVGRALASGHRAFNKALEAARNTPERHHALVDARALKVAWGKPAAGSLAHRHQPH